MCVCRPDRHESNGASAYATVEHPTLQVTEAGLSTTVLGSSEHAWMHPTGEAVEANSPLLGPEATLSTSTSVTCWITIWCFAQVHAVQLVSVGTLR